VHRFNLGLVFALAVGFARLMDLATDRAARVSRRVGAVCAGPLLAIGLGLLVMDVFSGESGLPRDAARLRLPKGLLVDAGPIQPVLKGPLPGTLGATLALLSGQPVGTPISLRVDPRARPGEFLSAAEEARLVAETPRLREGGVGVVAIFHKNFRRHPEHAPPPAPEALGQPTFFGEGVWSYRLR
jgi:hypothetical protein